MKKEINLKSITIILVLILLLIFCFPSYSSAAPTVSLSSNKDIVKQDEEFEISINLTDISAIALTLNIGYDNSKFEYLEGPVNSNDVNSSIIYTWFDETGGETPLKNNDIASFKFKAKVDLGLSLFHINGQLYGSDLQQITTEFKYKEIQIGQINQKADILIADFNNVKSQDIDQNSGFLKILRLDKEGISPNFEHDVYEYFIVTNQSIDELDVTAIPANEKDTVKITGNKNLKSGKNVIKIEVGSNNGNIKKTYTINVTKTSDVQSTNVNLETLAIEQAMLNPEYSNDVTKYEISVSNDMENLNILAIPKNSSTSVTIHGDKGLKVGNNTVTINVVGRDNITQRNITIIAHRNTAQEDKEEKQKIENNIEQTKALIENGELNIIESEGEGLDSYNRNSTIDRKDTKTARITFIRLTIVILFLLVTVVVIYLRKNKSRINKK